MIEPWIRFFSIKKEDSGVNRHSRHLRIGHWHFRKKWKLFHKFAQGNMIWLRRKFIWKSIPFVQVTEWRNYSFGISSKCSSGSSRAARTGWRNIHRPTDEAAGTSLPWPAKGKGCITVKQKGYFRKNGCETGAVTGLWQPPETTTEEEGKKVCGTRRKVQEDIKRRKGFSHTGKMPFRDSAFTRHLQVTGPSRGG